MLQDERVRVLRLTPRSGGRPGRVRNVALRAALAARAARSCATGAELPVEAAAAASAAVAEAPPHSGKVFTTGDHWIAFLDDDDEWLPVKLERQLTRMGSDGTLMACGGGGGQNHRGGQNTGGRPRRFSNAASSSLLRRRRRRQLLRCRGAPRHCRRC